MDSLLPSEIARLVLGYLEEQKCEEAARSFLEMSPHLQECRAVTSTGRRFSTRVNGFTLADILEKFCAANTIIQERLSKVSDCEQLKHCGDLLEQLRFLVDGSRGQRFVVNINVPTASQSSGGSPIISSSIRKRRHSVSDRDRSKRAHKSHLNTLGKSSDPVSTQLSCDAVETTPLEHLPGHSGSEKMENPMEKSLEKSLERSVNSSSNIVEEINARSLTENPQNSVESIKSMSAIDFVKTSLEKEDKIHERCSTATDTEELMHYTNTEVQTTYSVPYDVAESENEANNEPVENLSLLTKELLNRTELQERIAENINKAILPSDISLRDISLSDSIAGEMNTSIMTELNNAIKSVVSATESDPVFAKFLDEIIGPDGGNDTSPDEDGDHQPFSNEELPCETDPISKETVTELFEEIASQKPETTEVPLKNRLRSSTSQQPIRPEDDRGSQKLVEKDEAALEDVNAAAILSIINANSKLEEEKSCMEITPEILPDILPEILPVEAEKISIDKKEDDDIIEIATVTHSIPGGVEKSKVAPFADGRNAKRSNFRKPRVTKSKAKIAETIKEGFMSEEEIMAMPTLIVSSKEEITSLIGSQSTVTEPMSSGYCASQFLPIAPKGSEILAPPPKLAPVYLRTVTVPTSIQKNLKTSEKPLPNLPKLLTIGKPQQAIRPKIQTIQEKPNIIKEMENIAQTSLTTVLHEIPTSEGEITEKMTLYGTKNTAVALFDDSSIPKVQTDESISLSGTGLSPFLKFNNGKPDEKKIETSVPINVESEVNEIPSTSKQENFELITKRTPRSLLKSRSKNNRLSLSTPRRRSSHIRALDFNTPTKYMNSSRRMSINESLEFSSKNSSFVKKVCRTSLFKSPPFAATTSKKIKSPMKDRATCKVPIATRSPAPKLMGGWEKYTGVGMILGCSSPSSASCSPIKSTITSQTIKKNWDEDLRKSLQISEDTTTKPVKKATVKRPQRRKITKKIVSNKISDTAKEVSSGCKTRKNTGESDKDLPELLTALPVCPETKEISITEKILVESQKMEIPSEEKLPEKISTNSFDVFDATKNTEIIASTINSIEIPTSNNTIPKTDKIVKKKYVQLKTITTNVKKIDRDVLKVTSETIEKTGEFSRVYSESNRPLQSGNMMELETPRKYEDSFGIPPTPRLISPESNLTTPFGQLNDETSKVRGFVSTPEFPPTPNIAITPKQTSTDTEEAAKKDEFLACSTYYQPSSELKDPRVPKQQNDQSRHDMSLPLPGMSLAITEEKRVKNISSQVAQGFQACTTSEKWEITQFEVIKENLPREEAFRELNISTCSNETPEVEKKSLENQPEVEETEISEDIQNKKDPNNTSSTIDDSINDSSDSDSSSSSDSSTSSSSSSSSCSSVTNTSGNTTIRTRKTPIKINESMEETVKKIADPQKVVTTVQEPTTIIGSAEDDGNVIRLQVSRDENEASPQKVFSISKTDEELVDSVTETPAKDESLLSEAVISETPSSSKAAIETTNLNTKISAFINLENRDKTNEINKQSNGTQKALPIVVSVQRILPNVSIAVKPTSGSSDPLYNAMQCRNQPNAISDAKLSRQLEEKRLRVVAKFKEKEKGLVHRPRIKRAVCVTGGKRENRETAENGPETSEQIEEKVHSFEETSLKDCEEKEVSKQKETMTRKLKNEETNKNEKREIQKKSQKKYKEETKEIPEVSIPINEVTKAEPKNVASQSTERDENDKEKGNSEYKEKLKKPKSKSQLIEGEKEKNETEILASKETLKPDEIPEKSLDAKIIDDSPMIDEMLQPQIGENPKKDTKESAPLETKIGTKSKVDLVKRDLFSDDESNDQRTTRSRTRQTSDAQKTEQVLSPRSVSSNRCSSKEPSSSCPKEDMPGVLECLELVPTIKNDSSENNVILETSRQHHAEYNFIYDESVPTKRRRRKFSNSELEFPVEVELADENFRVCPKLMTATIFEEMFSISPARKRRGTSTKETSVKTTKYKKKESQPGKSAKTIFKDILEQPLATSSPVVKVTNPSKVAGKVPKSPSKKTEPVQVDNKKKSTLKSDNKQSEHEKQNPKARKRKASSSRESEQVDKKARSTNPQILLNKVDLDKFLTTVHGPA